jgi:ATP-binding protein involved in chromosome partitioning
MTTDQLRRSLSDALSRVHHPVTGQDVLASGHVQGLEVQEGGEVRFAFVLHPGDPGTLVKEVRAAAEAVPGVASVKVNVQLPRTPAEAQPKKGGLKPGSVPAPTPKPGLLPEVRRVIAVSSGKGGVGKSMVAANLAAGAAADGLRVGLLDADIYGPNIPLMFGETRRPAVKGPAGKERIDPLVSHGVKLMSLGFLLDKEQPAIMRGPLISGILKQFLEQVDWGALDLLVVDMPPGTGDAQLSLVQTIDLDGVVMVTTPQDVALLDVRKALGMFQRLNVPVLGIVENMSGFVCPHCHEVTWVFGSGGGERLAAELGLPFLGRIPLDAAVAKSGDEGTPTVLAAPGSPSGRALRETIRVVLGSVEGSDRAR